MVIRFIIYGIIGWCMEILWTGATSFIRKDFKLSANTSIWMFFIYGSVVFLEPLVHMLMPYPIIVRGIVYTICIFAAEYVCGLLLRMANVCPWDYSDSAYSVHGVIRLDYAPAWFIAGLVFETVYRFLF